MSLENVTNMCVTNIHVSTNPMSHVKVTHCMSLENVTNICATNTCVHHPHKSSKCHELNLQHVNDTNTVRHKHMCYESDTCTTSISVYIFFLVFYIYFFKSDMWDGGHIYLFIFKRIRYIYIYSNICVHHPNKPFHVTNRMSSMSMKVMLVVICVTHQRATLSECHELHDSSKCHGLDVQHVYEGGVFCDKWHKYMCYKCMCHEPEESSQDHEGGVIRDKCHSWIHCIIRMSRTHLRNLRKTSGYACVMICVTHERTASSECHEPDELSQDHALNVQHVNEGDIGGNMCHKYVCYKYMCHEPDELFKITNSMCSMSMRVMLAMWCEGVQKFFVYVYMYMYINIYIYMYIYKRIYIYTHTHTHTHKMSTRVMSVMWCEGV